MAQSDKETRFWPWVSAVLATVLTGIAVAGYSSARSDVATFGSQLHTVSERTSALEQANKDWSHRLQHIEDQLDRILQKR